MQTHIATTPFGRRPMSLAMLAVQKEADEIPEGKTVDKWQVYRDLCEGKSVIGVTDRSLAILAALLSFHPDSELSEEGGLIVFPSNKQLALRAHGMSDTTLRRHLAALVGCGLIIRRDSPNGKRYARKGREGGFEDAFGFSLAPILARADEFARAAETVRAENKALRQMRERITLLRRDIGKLIETALDERIPGDWMSLWRRFRQIVETIPRRATIDTLSPIFDSLAAIRNDIDISLEQHLKTQNPDGNESHSGRHQSNSNTNINIEFVPASKTSRGSAEPAGDMPELSKSYPLGLVLKACPEIIEYAVDGIHSWRDFMAVTAQVRGYLGISPSAYTDALEVMGQETTAIVIACILDRAQHINSAGGYLRALTEKAREGEFSAGPMLMAALRTSREPVRQAG